MVGHDQIVLLGHAFKFRVVLHGNNVNRQMSMRKEQPLNELVIAMIGDRDPEGQIRRARGGGLRRFS